MAKSGYMHPSTARAMKMKFKELKREVVARGMPFPAAVAADFPAMMDYFRKSYYETADYSLLDKYDEYQEAEIKRHKEAKGEKFESWITAPGLRLGFVGATDEDGNTKRKRIKGLKKKKIKRDRTSDGIFGGTKKALTYNLQQSKFTKEQTIKLVKEKFPDAQDKSISIWYNKAKKLHGSGS
jgi:hypothetical protein